MLGNIRAPAGVTQPAISEPTRRHVTVAEQEEEEEGQVEASLEELIAKKSDRPTITDDEDDDDSLLVLGRDEARESLTTKVLPVQQNEFVCKNCYLVKHRSQLADTRRTLCRDCA
jgi:Domain of unknown function (DUF4193)